MCVNIQANSFSYISIYSNGMFHHLWVEELAFFREDLK
jgi:hypothetical protein